MSTLLLNPNPFNVVSASGQNAQFLLMDEPGLVWRNSSASASLVVGLDGSVIDTVALAGTNLKAGSTVRIRLGSSESAVNGTAAVDITTTIAKGVPVAGRSFVIQKLPSAAAHSFLRIDITSGGGHIEVSRLVVGKSVNCDGVDIGAELTYLNDTKSYLDPKKTKPVWKVTVSGFTEYEKFRTWHPLLVDLGDQHGFLFVPYLEGDYVQEQASFGFMSGHSKGTALTSDYWNIDLQIQSII